MPPIQIIMSILAPFGVAAASVPQIGEIQTYKDWVVGCDNGGICQAVSLVPDQGGSGYDGWDGPVTIVRSPDQQGTLKIRVLIEAKEIDRYQMYVDGKLVDTGPIVLGDYPIEIVGTDAIKVADALINGNEMVVKQPDGKVITTISLAGSSAALRYMDAQQRRVGTPTALVAKGRSAFAPASTTIPNIPVDRWEESNLVPAPEDLIAFAEASACKNDRYGVLEDKAYALGKRGNISRALVLVSCGSGAYNFSSAPFVAEYVENGRATRDWTFKPARFDRQPSWGGEGVAPLLINAGWDERNQTLSSYAKGRGLGDCGNAENYVWDGEMFRLIDAIAMDECRGSHFWITVWRAKYHQLTETASIAK